MGSKDSSTRLLASESALLENYERLNTGEHKALVVGLMEKHAKASRMKWLWGVLASVVTALALGAILWLAGAATDKAKALITSNLAEKVEKQNQSNAEDHNALKLDISTIKTEQQNQGRVLKRVARKLKVEDNP